MVDYSGYNTANNYILPPEFYGRARTDAIAGFRRQNISRDIIPIRAIGGGLGVQSWDWTHESEMSEATLSWGTKIQTNEDQIALSRESIKIPVLHKEFRLDYREMLTASMNGYNIVTKNISAAAYQLAYLENQIVMDGYQRQDGSYEVKGLYQLAETVVNDDLPLSTYGNSLKAVVAGMNALSDKDLYGDMNLVMNNQDYINLLLSKNEFGITEKPTVSEIIGGKIINTYWQPKGTMMLVPTPGIGAVEMLLTQDVSMDTLIEPKSKDLWGQLYEALTIVCYAPDHIVKFTNVGSP